MNPEIQKIPLECQYQGPLKSMVIVWYDPKDKTYELWDRQKNEYNESVNKLKEAGYTVITAFDNPNEEFINKLDKYLQKLNKQRSKHTIRMITVEKIINSKL